MIKNWEQNHQKSAVVHSRRHHKSGLKTYRRMLEASRKANTQEPSQDTPVTKMFPLSQEGGFFKAQLLREGLDLSMS